MERSLALATGLNPYIGDKNATAVAAEAHAQGTTIREVVLRWQLMTEAQLDEALRPEALIQPRVYGILASLIAVAGTGEERDAVAP
jgi:aspartate ammonia-lyase